MKAKNRDDTEATRKRFKGPCSLASPALARFMLHVIDRSSAPPVAPAVVAQLEITSSGSVTAAAAAAAEGGADMPTREVGGKGGNSGFFK